MPIEPRIEVEGLRPLQQALKELGDKDLRKQLQVTNKTAGQMVADSARPTVPVKSGRAAASVKAAGTQTGGVVKAGGPDVPYFPFLDYGNKLHAGAGVGRGDSAVRPFIKGGRILYPALARERGAVMDRYEQDIQAVIRAAGFD